MSVAKVIELTATSDDSFEDAIQQGIARATSTLKNVEGAWIKEQKVVIRDGEITSYRVNMMITFVLEGSEGDEEEGGRGQARSAMGGGQGGQSAGGGGGGGRRR